jgi:hypothetical protein
VIAVVVGGTPQARQQVVGEERAAELVGLLGILGQRAGGQDDGSLAEQRRGDRA